MQTISEVLVSSQEVFRQDIPKQAPTHAKAQVPGQRLQGFVTCAGSRRTQSSPCFYCTPANRTSFQVCSCLPPIWVQHPDCEAGRPSIEAGGLPSGPYPESANESVLDHGRR